jgi:hypothetical protein
MPKPQKDSGNREETPFQSRAIPQFFARSRHEVHPNSVAPLVLHAGAPA